jgi:histone H3/H4
VKYSVRDVCDVNNLNYVDVLFSIGAQLYLQYEDSGRELRPELLKDLEAWRNNIVERVSEEESSFETSVGGGIRGLFISVMAKIRAEDTTRKTIREVIEPRLSELIDKINSIIADIEGREGKNVLVIIDDLDKPNLEQATEIFYNNQTAITQPVCHIVYTVPISMFFAQEFIAIWDRKFSLPNIKLHAKNDRTSRYEPGYDMLKTFIFKRMKEDLIEPDAVDLAIKMGAGVFRESSRIMQIAADSAIERGRDRVTREDVEKAVRERRSDFNRILHTDDYGILEEVYKNNDIRGIEKIGHLLHNLSVLEYENDENWCDIHPTLKKLLDV